MERAADGLEDWIAGELGRPVHPMAAQMAGRLRAEFGQGVCAVLHYGSCLRDPDFAGTVADFYVLVDAYRDVHGSAAMALLNRLVPPNVYFRTMEIDGTRAQAKVAVLSLRAFEAGAGPTAVLASVWGRFCQPSRLVYARDPETARRVTKAVVSAATTFAARTAPLVPPGCTAAEFWTRGLRESYRTELRVESGARARALYDADQRYFDALYARLAPTPGASAWRTKVSWFWRRVLGKTYSVVRLVKAAFTFEGGADYICWKIARHSGVKITLSPWQRRHPVLASTVLFWTLYRKGAFR